jgi:hypothetical protein
MEPVTAETDSAERRPFLEARPTRRRKALVVVFILIVAGVIVVGSRVFDRKGVGSGSPVDNGAATSVATVQRRTLSTQTQFNGVLGYAGSYTAFAQGRGTVTWLPRPGQVIRNGQVLYEVDGSPIVLLAGSVPAYRTLAAGETSADVTGTDVAQLNHDLVTLGYLPRAEVAGSWSEYSWATTLGVQKLQKRLGMAQTGRLTRSEVVFLPTAARVTTLDTILGAPVRGPVLTATSTARIVSVSVAAGEQSAVKAGDRVTITLPDNRSTPGTVTSVGATTASADGSSANGGSSNSGPVVPVTIALNAPRTTTELDQAPVLVSITNRTVSRVLAVPVTALLALAGGGYAVEVVATDGTHHLEAVTPGLFDDAAGLVQVAGSELAAGQHVVVPGP